MINIDGVTKDDVKVPEGELGEQLEAAFEKGDDVRREAARLRPSTDFLVSQIVVTVVSAMGTEQAMSYKEGQVRRNRSNPPRAVLTFLFVTEIIASPLYSLPSPPRYLLHFSSTLVPSSLSLAPSLCRTTRIPFLFFFCCGWTGGAVREREGGVSIESKERREVE